MNNSLDQQYSLRIKNRHSHNCEITAEDYEQIKPKIEMLKCLAEIENSIYAVFDLHKNQYLLQSKEQQEIFGVNTGDNSTIDIHTHYQRIHPDDRAFVLETDNMLIRFFSEMPFNEKKNYKLVYDFRTENTDGIYVRHVHQSIPFAPDKNGRTWLTLVITHPISERPANEKPQRRLVNIKTGKLHLFNEIDGHSSGIVLTNREREILLLISRGYDSYNIADKLKISINTVNNHRQNILRKTNADNATQAVMYCKQLGIL